MKRKFFFFAFLCILFSFSDGAQAATYYVGKSGADGNSCATAQSSAAGSRKLSIGSGLGCLSAGDTLSIGDGTYAETLQNIPNGSVGNYITIRAENDHGVVMTGLDMVNTDAYISIRGINFRSGSNGKSILGNHLKFKLVEFRGGASSGNEANLTVGSNDFNDTADILLEDIVSHGIGNGRYNILIYNSDRVVVRRAVIRHDGGWTGPSNPSAGINFYVSSDSWCENCIILDSIASLDWSGAFYMVKNSSVAHANNGNGIIGSIMLNNPDLGLRMDASSSGNNISNVTLADNVLWDNAMMVRRGIEAAAKDAVAELQKMAKPVKGKAEIRQVASISAESEELGKTIADTVEKVGKDGVVTVEESQSVGIESDFVEGLEFDKGYVSPYMITNAERMEAEIKEPAILITDRKISVIKDILPLLEKLVQTGRKDLVIIADDVDGEALATFIVNKLKGVFNVLAVKAPGYGDRKKDMLQDIAVTVGATVISEDLGLKLENADVTALGRASRVVATKDSTTIVGGKGKKADIEARAQQLRAQAANTDSKYDKEKIEERVAKLSGGVAVIRVGAATETEMKYLKDKIEDAVNATKAAIAEGIVPGGGAALARVGDILSKSGEEFGAQSRAVARLIVRKGYHLRHKIARDT
jgi:chaperonin GroEL